MRNIIGICLFALLMSTNANAAEEISYTGYRTDTLADIYQGNWKVSSDELSGELYLPDGDGPFPVVILQHGSSHPNGMQPWWDRVIPELNNAGIGVFIANSYDGRGIGDTVEDQRQLSKAARIVDALMALKVLSEHPKIDGSKIGISGYSFGGIVAFETANRRFVEEVLGDSLKFASHLPVYPSCGGQHEIIDMTGKPMLFLVGRDDNYTPAEFCEEYIIKLQAAGVPATIKVYLDAGHGFTSVVDQRLKRAATFNDCGYAIIDVDGYHTIGGVSERGKSWREFIVAAWQKCGSRGANIYGTKVSRSQTLTDTVEFFTKTLTP